jgi:E3 ubiquitin-protein ligase RNF115/126
MEPARDNAVLTRCNHRFHSACVTPWLNSHRTCPMCRNTNPTPLVHAPPKRQRQGGGGGSRKTRSKSKSKTRRLRKSRNKSRSKPRKSYKSRKPRSSSRRR